MMASKNIAVFGIYANQVSAEAAVETLRNAGFRNTDVSVLVPDNQGTKDFAIRKESKAPEGAAAGGLTGGMIGGALGWLAGAGMLATIPGIGPGIGSLLAAGPILSLMAGVGVGGTIGGVAGALAGLGIPEYEAKRYEGRIRKGGILLSVHSDNDEWAKRAKNILEHTGADDISSASEAKADFAVADRPKIRPTPRMPATAGTYPSREDVPRS